MSGQERRDLTSLTVMSPIVEPDEEDLARFERSMRRLGADDALVEQVLGRPRPRLRLRLRLRRQRLPKNRE